MLRAFLLLLLLIVSSARADAVAVAVAANFREPLEAMKAPFAAATGHELVISAGSTGQLYAQIAQGAPYDVFLAADQERPAAAVAAGLAVDGSAFTYAEGRLYALVRPKEGQHAEEALREARRISIANPRTAPYGAAAVDVMHNIWLTHIETAQAQSVAGVNAAFDTGAVDAGFAAFSTVARADPRPPGWLVPKDLHRPIRQDAVLLTRAADSVAARAFLDWLKGSEARALIESYGYD